MQTKTLIGLVLGALVTVLAIAVPPLGNAAAQARAQKPPDPEQILKNFIVVGDAKGRPLPKIGVAPSLAINEEDITLHTVVTRDLDLCGEFEVLPPSAAPEDDSLSGKVDVKAWKKKGAEAVVKLSGKRLPGGKVALEGLAYFTDTGDTPVYDKRIVVDANRVRAESHRIADALIGALTGTNGGFSSQMTFIYGTGKARRAYVMDADGHDPTVASAPNQVALSPTFGPDQTLYYAASTNKGLYKVYARGERKSLKFKPRGSVYGLAFSHDRSQVALSIGHGPAIKIFAGPDFFNLQPASEVESALHPAWTPSGKLAFSGAGRWGQRIYVDGKAISPSGLNASAPVFCRHPDGIRAIYMVGVGKNTDLVASGEKGGSLARLTQHQGRNNYPACSPDGRLIAFFSTRKSTKGPGLYIMRIDGMRPKRISTLVGDSLRWARLPELKAAPKSKARGQHKAAPKPKAAPMPKAVPTLPKT